MPKNPKPFITDHLDLGLITHAILTTKRGDGSDEEISSVAKEMALHLVQGWIEQYADVDFAGPEIIGVELPFYMWVDRDTLVVGVTDRIQHLGGGHILNGEWKTKGASKGKRWGEEWWLGSMENGSQLPIYALASEIGTFIQKDGTPMRLPLTDDSTFQVMVRAAVKQIPPIFYPTDPRQGLFQYDVMARYSIQSALRSRAEMIRAARRNKAVVPWQATGEHCMNHYGHVCEFHEKFCKRKEHVKDGPAIPGFLLSPGDPGGAAVGKAIEGRELTWDLNANESDLVILSASSYEMGTRCMEEWRIHSAQINREASNEDLEIGTGFHAGVAAVNVQLMQLQKSLREELNGKSNSSAE